MIGFAAPLDELGGGSLALAEAGPAVDTPAVALQLLCELLGAEHAARRVHADVHDRVGVSGVVESEQLVERGDPVRLGRRHLEHVAQVVEATRADPADVVLQGV